MIEKVEGIILATIPFKETSLVLNVYTKKYGLIGIMAKGAKSLKSSLRIGSQTFTYGYFYIYYKEDKLSLLKDVDIIDNFSNLKQDIILIGYLSYLCDLTKQTLKENNTNLLYDDLIKALIKINDHFDPLIITNIYEIKVLPYLGIALNLDGCVKCGSKEGIVTLDPDLGGYICHNCYSNQMIVNVKTIKMIRMYYYVDIASIKDINISKETKNEINEFLTRYLDRYSGLYLKSKEFLKKISSD